MQTTLELVYTGVCKEKLSSYVFRTYLNFYLGSTPSPMELSLRHSLLLNLIFFWYRFKNWKMCWNHILLISEWSEGLGFDSNLLCRCHNGGSNIEIQTFDIYISLFTIPSIGRTFNRGHESIATMGFLWKQHWFDSFIWLDLPICLSNSNTISRLYYSFDVWFYSSNSLVMICHEYCWMCVDLFVIEKIFSSHSPWHPTFDRT